MVKLDRTQNSVRMGSLPKGVTLRMFFESFSFWIKSN